ncbi:hypothetical protein EIP86_005961 [Pleurotus ostreatoroseus]|nr:hypothetical protein EIP86_005961 [Pleurotus ostreatoroseus]
MAVFEARHPTRKTKVVQLEVMDSFEVTGNMGFLFDQLARVLPCLGEARRNLKGDIHRTTRSDHTRRPSSRPAV